MNTLLIIGAAIALVSLIVFVGAGVWDWWTDDGPTYGPSTAGDGLANNEVIFEHNNLYDSPQKCCSCANIQPLTVNAWTPAPFVKGPYAMEYQTIDGITYFRPTQKSEISEIPPQ